MFDTMTRLSLNIPRTEVKVGRDRNEYMLSAGSEAPRVMKIFRRGGATAGRGKPDGARVKIMETGCVTRMLVR